MLKDFFNLSLNNLKRRKLRSWLTMLGIFIGIAAVVALISLGQGLQTAITGQFESLSVDTLTVQNADTGYGPPGSTVVEKLTEHDLELIEDIAGVEYAESILMRMAKVEYNNGVSFDMVRSAPEESDILDDFYKAQAISTIEGRLLKKGDYGKVVLGNGFSDKNKYGKAVRVGKTIEIQDEKFEVIGIMKKSGNPLMNNVILMFHSDIEEVFGIEDEIDLIGIRVESTDIVEETAERIKKALRKDRGLKEGEEDFSVETPLEALGAIDTVLTTVNIVVVGIAMISLIVGGIGIANTMYTSVLERNKEIGTMKAIGARNSDILSIFLLESGFLGLVGGLIGALIGIGFSLGIANAANSYFESQIIAVNISLPLLIFALSFSFLIGILSGVIPSYQASKLKPVDALRA